MPAGWFLCQSLKSKGFEDVYEIYRNINEPFNEVIKEIISYEPDYLLLSVYVFNAIYVKRLIAETRRLLPECVIIAGGPEADETFDAHHIVIGEGEEALYTLITEGGGKVTYAKPVEDLDSIPSPYTPERLEASRNKLIYYEASRGCPFKCSYCMAGLSQGVRYFGSDRVKKDLVNIVNGGAQIIKFTDRTFNADARRANEILSFILETFGDNPDVCFHFEVGADLFTESTLELLSRMPKGLIQLEAGIQSLNPLSLKAVNRSANTRKLIKNIQKILGYGNIHLHLDLIAGLPHETLDSFKEGFGAVYALKPHKLQLGFLKFLKYTPIREFAGAVYGSEPPYEVISTPTLSQAALAELKSVEKVFERLYNSGRFFYTLEYLSTTESSPYNLYLSLAEHLLPIKDNSDYGIQKALLSYKGGLPHIKETLRLDYLLCNPINKIPKILKREYSAEFKSFVKELKPDSLIGYEEFAFLPDKGEGRFIARFDYRNRDRVTGRYAFEVI